MRAVKVSSFLAVAVLVAILAPPQAATANPIVPFYSWGETLWQPPPSSPPAPSAIESHMGGPVLADDFRTANDPYLSWIFWWGDAAHSPDWQITFFEDAGGLPGTMIAQQMVSAAGCLAAAPPHTAPFCALWTHPGPDLQVPRLLGGEEYWISIANAAPGWHWSSPTNARPEIGAQQYSAAMGFSPGGPWASLPAQSFAVTIWQTPEPTSVRLVGAGLAGLAGLTWRRRRRE